MDEATTADVIRQFNEAFLNHDSKLLVELIADDCILENTQPAPNGARYEGRAACLALWSQIATAPGTHFVLEEVVVAADRALIFWRYCWGQGDSDSVRGVNCMRVRAGKIIEARGYVKGV